MFYIYCSIAVKENKRFNLSCFLLTAQRGDFLSEDFDMVKFLEMAKAISSLTSKPERENSQPQKNQEQQNTVVAPVTKSAEEAKEVTQVTTLPFEFETKESKIVKSIIPYFDRSYQKQMAIVVKMLELKKIHEYYNDEAVITTSIPNNENWRSEMLMAIRPHIEEEKQYLIDLFIRFMEMNQIMQKRNSDVLL